jgi:hypothetical protein
MTSWFLKHFVEREHLGIVACRWGWRSGGRYLDIWRGMERSVVGRDYGDRVDIAL